MPASLIQYRLRVRTVSTLANPDGLTDAFIVSSVPGDALPFIAAAPTGDGQEVDPITGAVRTGAYTVEIVDATTGTDGTGTIRALTSRLEDAQFRQQLLSRRAIVEVRTDGGAWGTLVSGFISGVRLISPMRYQITVGDSRRVEQTQTIFQGGALGGYTTRGCITGGPLTVDWGPFKARGGWEYLLTNIGTNLWQARFTRGYAVTGSSNVSNDWRKVLHPSALQVVATYVRENPYPSTGAPETYDFAFAALGQTGAIVDGIVAYIGNAANNAVATNAVLIESSETAGDNPLDSDTLVFYWPACPYASGTKVFISLTTAVPNESCPLYLDAHPVDLVTAIWTNARIEYDTTAASNIKTLLGDNVRLACRFTVPPTIADFFSSAIFGPFGISARTNSASKQQLFATRIRLDTTPTATLSTTALLSSEPLVFDLDEQTAVSAVTLRQQVFNVATAAVQYTNVGPARTELASVPLDGVGVQAVEQTSQYVDANLTVFTGRNVTYDVPGMIHTSSDWAPATSTQLQAISLGIFDRFGRGCQSSEAQVLAGTAAASAQIGDELYYDVAHFPNKGYRIGESTVGPRIMQVVRRTETPSGPVFKLLDSGLAAQPATAATISIAKNANAPTAIAQFTVTNAATLNATNAISVRIQWATGSTTPSGGANFITYAPSAIETAAVDLPAVTIPGTTVYVRARSEQAGLRPSAWTAWASVALDAIPTITPFAIGTTTQTSAAISWTNTSSTLPIVVFAIQSGTAPANWSPYRLASIPPGSTSTIVRTLTGPSVTWTIGVAYESAGILGPVTSASVTTNSTLGTTGRPAGLQIIAGLDDVTQTQGIALALWPADQTLDVVIERSTTTGSGFAEIARVAGSTPTYVDERPRDGVTYYYRTAHVLGGFGLSPYTQEVNAIARGVGRDLVRPDAVTPVVVVSTTEVGTTATVLLSVTDPQGRVEQVRFRERTGGGAWSVWTIDSTVPYSYSATIPATGFVDIEYEVTGYTAAGVAGLLAGGIESFDRNAIANIVSAVGTFTLTGALSLAVQADTDTNSFKYAIATSPWANDADAYTAAQAGTLVSARNLSTTLTGPYAVGSSVYLAIAAYTGAGGTGTVSGPNRYTFTNGSRDTVPLLARARVTSTTATTLVVRVAVATPVALDSPGTASIAYVELGVSGTTPGSPQTVTPNVSDTITEITSPAQNYVDFTVPRPAVGNDPGRITFLITAPNRVAAVDAVDLVPQDRIGPSLQIVTTPGTTSYSLVVTWDGAIVYNLDGASQSVSGWTSPRTVTINRNAAGGASKAAAFAVTKNGTTTSDSVTVPAQDPVVVTITAFSIVFDYTNNYLEYNYTLTGLPGSYDVRAFALLNGVATGELPEVSSTSTQTVLVSPVPLDSSGTVTNNWELWFEVTDSGVQVLATSVTLYGTTYEP